MYQAIIVIHILLGLGIIGLILMQQGKGADAGATFGGGASGSVFGAQGAASFLSRTTAILASLFFATSLGLAWINSNKGPVTDIMNTPGVEKEAAPDLGLPNVDGAKPKESLPAPQAGGNVVAPKAPDTAANPTVTAPPAEAGKVQTKVVEIPSPAKTGDAVAEEQESEKAQEKPGKTPEQKKK
jgi:preprotein translocase subunit SecG